MRHWVIETARGVRHGVREAARGVMLAVIYAYRGTLGSFLGGQCRFHPTCSAYGIEAIKEWGPWRGGWMTVRRILRCHPFCKGGVDLVPRREADAGWTPEAPTALKPWACDGEER